MLRAQTGPSRSHRVHRLLRSVQITPEAKPPANYRDTLQYLNPAAFQRIPVSAASGAPFGREMPVVGVARAPGMWNVDFSLAKNFSLRENVRLQIRTDMFNALNHTNLSG